MSPDPSETIACNGIDGSTGMPLLPPLTVESLARVAQGFSLAPSGNTYFFDALYV
jgi:hypothetical protein